MRFLDRSVAWAAVLLLASPVVLRGQEPQGPAPRPETKTESPRPGNPEAQRHLISEAPGGKKLEIAAGPGSILGKDELILKEYVDIKYGDTRLQADFVRYIPSTKQAHADGNVVLDQGPSRITAESLDYNLDSETGTFYQARGYADPAVQFEAARIEKISKDELVLHDATFTSCTQPIPYWSFKFSRGLLRLNDYAYLHDLRFKVGRVPIFYSPYLVWPIKTDRASGLLFPEFGYSRRGGTILSEALYWAIKRNMDATFFLDYLSLAGIGTGVEYRFIPNELGRGTFTGYFIEDQVAKEQKKPGVPVDRWTISYSERQDYASDWHLVANANFISDFDYYRDFERDLRLSTTPVALSNAFLSRNFGFYSLNLRAERREQLVGVNVDPSKYGDPFLASKEETLVRWIGPEVELRGRRQRLGDSPLFLTLESSAGAFGHGEAGANYERLDFFPVLSSQVSPVPWLDVDASLGIRDTYYSKRQLSDLGCDGRPHTRDFGEGNGLVDSEHDNPDPITGQFGTFGPEDDLGCDNLPGTGDFGEGDQRRNQEGTIFSGQPFNRDLYQAGLTLIGPKMSRVFDRPDSNFSPQYKNTIEPTVRYSYTSSVNNPGEIIQFDQIDTITGNTNRLTYGFVTRLFAKRPAGNPEDYAVLLAPTSTRFAQGGTQDTLLALKEAARRQRESKGADEEGRPQVPEAGRTAEAENAPAEPKKKPLSTVEVASLEISQDYSFLGPLSLSTALGVDRQVSPINTTLRINPSLHAGIDLRTSYDILFRQIKEASLSANLRSPRRGFLDFSWSIERDLEGKALLQQGLALTQPFNRSQIGLSGETNLFERRLLLGLQTNYELGDVFPGQPRFRDQRYRLGYNTQCCGFQVEVLNRNFLGSSQREVRFLINLKGVGNVIDFQSGIGPGPLP